MNTNELHNKLGLNLPTNLDETSLLKKYLITV